MREQPFQVSIPGGTLRGHRGGEGRPALLLHGGPAVPDYMGGCARALDGLFAAIHYTQRGTPPSTVGPPYSIESHMADAIAVLDSFALDKAWVIGHSWGGHLALHLLLAHPQRLQGILCIDPLGAVDPFPELAANRRRNLASEQAARIDEIEELRRDGEASEEDLLERWAIAWPLFFVDPANVAELPKRVGVQCSTDANASLMAHFEQGTLERGLPNTRLPALFVHGDEDPLPVRSSIQTAALIPGARVEVIPDCGHFPWLERPAEFREAVERLLETSSASARNQRSRSE